MREKILIIDDDEGMRFFLKEALSDDYDITCRSNPLEARKDLTEADF